MIQRDLSHLLGSTADVLPASPSTIPPSSTAAAAMEDGAGYYRQYEKHSGLAYDGSAYFDDLALWNPPIASADAEVIPEKNRLEARSRDTARNDAYVAGGSTIYKDGIVGAQYILNAKPKSKVLFGKEDPVWETEFQEEVETKFHLWAESPQNWTDAGRINTLTGLVRLAIGVYTVGGEVLSSAEWMPKDGRPFRSAIQMIDTDRLSTPFDRLNDIRIRGGVERDKYGAPVAYHIREVHPYDGPFYPIWDAQKYWTWNRIPTRKPWGRQLIMHIYEQRRPHQTRGVGDMVTALTEMRMTKHFRKTELQRAVIAATYAASLESDLPQDAAWAMGLDDSNGSPTGAWIKHYMNMVNSFSGSSRNLHIDGVKIPTLMPGTKLHIQNPGAASPTGDRFEASLLRHIATALGVSYEELSRDYTNTNYSSARASMAQTWKTMRSRKKFVADRTANFLYRLWLEECVNYNLLETLKRPRIAVFYEGLNAEAYSACEWIGASHGQIDPLKETQAATLRVRNGFSTKEREIAQMTGGDWREVSRQIKRERELDAQLENPSIYDQTANQNMTNALSGTPSDGGSN